MPRLIGCWMNTWTILHWLNGEKNHYNSLGDNKIYPSRTIVHFIWLTITENQFWNNHYLRHQNFRFTYLRVSLTSSRVGWLPSTLGFAFLASFGAVILERHSCLSGGGPPRGWPRIITESPDKTYKRRKYWAWVSYSTYG